MIRPRLVEILLGVVPGQLNRIFRIGKLRFIHQTSWETHFVGASAVTRVIEALDDLEGTRIAFPTLQEQLDWGIDLFVEYPPRHKKDEGWPVRLVINLSSFTNAKREILTHHVTDLRAAAMEVAVASEQITRGAGHASRLYYRPFRAVHIRVGRESGDGYNPEVYKEDVDVLDDLLNEVEEWIKRARGVSPGVFAA